MEHPTVPPPIGSISSPVGMRVNLTSAFVDLCDFTTYTAARGDEAALAELQTLRGLLREVAPLFGLRVDKWLGDGAMLIGFHVEQVVAATVALVEQHRRRGELPMRVGLAAGPVLLLEGDDYTGRAINLAARLCDNAAPGEILASTDDLHIPEGVLIEREDTISIRGFGEAVPVVALGADPAVLDEHRPGMLLLDVLLRPVRSLRHGLHVKQVDAS